MKAAEKHLSLSVGSHAWPTRGNIGVGIHERARPKFEERREQHRLRAIADARQRQLEKRAAKSKIVGEAKHGERHGRNGGREQDGADVVEQEGSEDAEESEDEDEEAWKLEGDAGQAYMLADDTTRRWLQALRRLITHFEHRGA